MKLFKFLFYNPYPIWLRVLGSIIFVLLFVIFFYYRPSFNEKVCDDYNETLNDAFSGVVVEKKKIDYMRIKIKQSGDVREYNLSQDKSGLFEYLQVGDSIFKSEDSHSIIIKRNDHKEIFELDFGCDTTQLD